MDYFDHMPHRVSDGNIVYAKDLNNPLSAIDVGVKRLRDNIQTGEHLTTGTDIGFANNYKVNLDTVPDQLRDGLMVWFKPVATNTGASTIDVNDLGAKPIRTNLRTALVGKELVAGYWFQLKYSTNLSAWIIVSDVGKTELDNTRTITEGTDIKITTTSDEIKISSFGGVPIGGIIPFLGGYFSNAANGGFVNVIGNNAAAINALVNPYYFVCNGAACNVAGAPVFNGPSRYLPNITDERFLLGSTTGGAIGGSNDMEHDHSITHDHTMAHSHPMAHTHTLAHTHNVAHIHDTQSFTLGIPHIPDHPHTIVTTDGEEQISESGDYFGVKGFGGRTVKNTSSVGGGLPHNHGNTLGSSAPTSGAASVSTSSGVSTASTGGASTITTSAASNGTSGLSSVTDNKPKFLACNYLIRVI